MKDKPHVFQIKHFGKKKTLSFVGWSCIGQNYCGSTLSGADFVMAEMSSYRHESSALRNSRQYCSHIEPSKNLLWNSNVLYCHSYLVASLVLLNHVMWHNVLCRVVSYRIVSYRIVSYCFFQMAFKSMPLCDVTSPGVIWNGVVGRGVTWHGMT